MQPEDCILCVGRNRRNQELLSQVLTKAGHAVKLALSYESIVPVVKASSIALVLLDVSGFDQEVWQVCEMLRSHTIPFFIIVAPHQAHLPAHYRVNGSLVPLLVKPLSIRPLLTLIAHTLQRQP